jgi:hypothetical protein
VASVISVEIGVTVALVELTLGVLVGNVFGIHSQSWLDFVASFAAGIIDRTQFSLLVTVVVLSAVVPTFVAGRSFLPDADEELRLDHRQTYARVEEYV